MAAANEVGRMFEFEYDGLLESSIENRIKFKGMSRVEAEACVRKEMEEIAGKVRIYQRAAARPWLPLPPEIANLKVEEPDPFPSHCGYILNEIRRQSAGRKMDGGSAHPP
jgi:hypothetical protein